MAAHTLRRRPAPRAPSVTDAHHGSSTPGRVPAGRTSRTPRLSWQAGGGWTPSSVRPEPARPPPWAQSRLSGKHHFGPGTVVGLAPAAASADVLGHELGLATDNVTKWLYESTGPGAAMRAGHYAEAAARYQAASIPTPGLTGPEGSWRACPAHERPRRDPSKVAVPARPARHHRRSIHGPHPPSRRPRRPSRRVPGPKSCWSATRPSWTPSMPAACSAGWTAPAAHNG